MEISKQAMEYMVALEQQYTAGICTTPATAKAGASKEARAAMAELKAAKMVQLYKNADCPDGHTVFRFTSEGKDLLMSEGVQSAGCCYAYNRTYYGNVIDTRPNYS